MRIEGYSSIEAHNKGYTLPFNTGHVPWMMFVQVMCRPSLRPDVHYRVITTP